MIEYNPNYPLKHLSIRVPWHDNKWNGTVCNAPDKNGACLILSNCSTKRDDDYEVEMAGISLKVLQDQEKKLPPCLDERATFMSPDDLYKVARHPYIDMNEDNYGHLKETTIRFPKFSAAAVPYHWMLKENVEAKKELYNINYQEHKEPKLNFKDTWIQHFSNQQAFLKCFFQHLQPETSLVFFYAKQVPFVEESGRVLVGVGRITSIAPSKEYVGSGKNGQLRTGYWEHIIHHSIREEFEDGFLLPYHEALKHQKENPSFDPSELAVVVPNINTFEFSYAAEHVGNITAIKVLLQCVKKWELAKELGIGKHHDKAIKWLHDQIAVIQKLKGDYPGMGSALCAFGIDLGHFVAAQLTHITEEGENPWDKFEEALNHPERKILPENLQSLLNRRIKKKYQRLKDKSDQTRINFLHLLSRFELTQDQAKLLYKESKRIELTDINEAEFLENPYLLYEITRFSEMPIDLDLIDMGVFIKKPFNGTLRPDLDFDDDGKDERRVRAMIISLLEGATLQGHTLQPRKGINSTLIDMPLDVKCDVDEDDLDMVEEEFGDEVVITKMKDGSNAYQLKRFDDCRTIIRDTVISRHEEAELIELEADWRTELDKTINQPVKDETDESGRQEKTAALQSIATSRISVLIGGAGTGKTTLLTALGNYQAIKERGVLFLAPTGKARVRMVEAAEKHGVKMEAFTLAQFLFKYNRYDGRLFRYVLSNDYCEKYDTVIIDEASMMTEEMLATLFDCFSKGVERIILVGDHRQLPPIGAGRPFLDIINYLKPNDIVSTFPKVAKGYAELTVNFRQAGQQRIDIKLANWFSGNELNVAADQILTSLLNNKNSKHFRMVAWSDENDFIKKFEEVLVEEIPEIQNIDDIQGFKKSLGSADGSFFNDTNKANYFGIEPSVNKIEDWQFLSPVREKTFGVRAINRYIHQQFRKSDIEQARRRKSSVPKPVGAEEILYGDKIINLQNRSRKYITPQKEKPYIANGEMGLLTGKFATKKEKQREWQKPREDRKSFDYLEIEFSSQKGYVYRFYNGEFGDDANIPLELAYAITVHKSQGSEFKKVFLVLPDPCFLLTREMLYTALTRQKDKVILLYQGTEFKLLEYSKPRYSDAIKRMTNLFHQPSMREVKGTFLEEYLIHQAKDGQLLRSKSELLIYQELADKGFKPVYEKALHLNNDTRYPDFTIDYRHQNSTIYYWEHCGMMHDPEYVKDWEEKRQWYKDNDILPWEDGGGKNGTLIVSYDKPTTIKGKTRGAFSLKDVETLIKTIFKK